LSLAYPEELAIGDRFPDLCAYQKGLLCSLHTKYNVNTNIVLMANDMSTHDHSHSTKKPKKPEQKTPKHQPQNILAFFLAILRVLSYQSNCIYSRRLPRSTMV